MRKIAVIDPYMIAPALSSFNKLATSFPTLIWTYHQPHRDDFKSLKYDEYDAYVIFGSASHVFEKLPWQIALKNYLMNELEHGKPTLGICFGHQLLCEAFGSDVEFFHANEDKICGLGKVQIIEPILNFSGMEELNFVVTHRQVVSKLGPGLKAFGKRIEPQLANDLVYHEEFPFIGTQAHVEASLQFAREEGQIDCPVALDTCDTHSLLFFENFLRYFGLISE